MMATETKLPVTKQVSGPSLAPEVWRPFEALRKEVDRLFDDFGDDFWRKPFRSFAALERNWPKKFPANPAVDVTETEKAYEITAELPGMDEKWEDELERWLKPFLDRLGHKTRQRMCPLYVAGLIGPRESVQPMAERLATGNYDQLHHFIVDGVWDATSLGSELLHQADRLVGGTDAVLVVDDTATPKKGERSVGVAA